MKNINQSSDPYIVRALYRLIAGIAAMLLGFWSWSRTGDWKGSDWYTGLWEIGLRGGMLAMIVGGGLLALIVVVNTVAVYSKYLKSTSQVQKSRRHHES